MANHRCAVKLIGRGCEHDLCVSISREVPPRLRCDTDAPAGYGAGGGSRCGCRIPQNLPDLVSRSLRDDLQECLRLGFVRVQAA